MQHYVLMIYTCIASDNIYKKMKNNLLLNNSRKLAANIEMLCQNTKMPTNSVFQIRKSSSSVYASNYINNDCSMWKRQTNFVANK